jgi:hypothetical protein
MLEEETLPLEGDVEVVDPWDFFLWSQYSVTNAPESLDSN